MDGTRRGNLTATRVVHPVFTSVRHDGHVPGPDLTSPAASGSSALLRSDHAPSPRTLVDIVRESTREAPDASALDNGSQVLTYEELLEAAEAFAAALAESGVGRGDRVGLRVASGTLDLYVAILGILVAGAAYVPVDVDDPDSRARLVFCLLYTSPSPRDS